MNELVKVENNDIIIAEEFRNKLIEFEKVKKEIEYQSELLKSELLELMPQIGKDRIILDGILITYKKGSKRTTIDTKRLKEENPEIAELYQKTSNVDPTILIKVEG